MLTIQSALLSLQYRRDSLRLTPRTPQQPVFSFCVETALGTHSHPLHHFVIFAAYATTQVHLLFFSQRLLSALLYPRMCSTKTNSTRRGLQSSLDMSVKVYRYVSLSVTKRTHSAQCSTSKERYNPAGPGTHLAQLVFPYCGV